MNKNQKGFSAVAGIIIGFLILGVVVGGALILKKPSERANPFESKDLKVDDVIAGMKVVSIKPFYERLQGKLPPELNVIIQFTGRAAISGVYWRDEDLLGCNLLKLDDISQKVLPAINRSAENGGVGFVRSLCLNNSESKLDFKKGGQSKIVIDNLVLISYPSEVAPSADLVSVLEDQPK